MIPEIDYEKLVENILEFEYCVRYFDSTLGYHSETLSFSDSGSWLRSQEYYKYEVFAATSEALNCTKWSEEDIGSGKISKIVQHAINCTGNKNNLIDQHQKTHFNNQFSKHPDYARLDQAFFDLYRGHDDEKAFQEIVDIFGRKYDLVAFLFFVKNPDIYLPIHSSDFDYGFERLGFQYRTAKRCSWENYLGFLGCIKEIQRALNELLPLDSPASLLDAHSFTWIVVNDFYSWQADENQTRSIQKRKKSEAAYLQNNAAEFGSSSPEKKDVKASAFKRDPKVIVYAKERANGICQLCGTPAPFKDKEGKPYLETHHVVWLSRGGADKIFNTVALCPNCHSKMHIVDDPKVVKFLREKALGIIPACSEEADCLQLSEADHKRIHSRIEEGLASGEMKRYSFVAVEDGKKD